MRHIKPLHFVVLFACCLSCGDDNDPTLQVPEDIVNKSLSLFDGTVIEKEADQEEGVSVWEVRIENNSGSRVQFYWTQADGSLFRMDGERGPFDYDINPGSGLISFSTAKNAAISAVKNNDIVEWRCRREDSFANKWVYTFEISDAGNILKVSLDGENGDVLDIS